jgi:hypothetical protein
MGDVIFGLKVIQRFGRGDLFLGNISTNASPMQPRKGIGAEEYSFMMSLLLAQPYLKRLYYTRSLPMYNKALDKFRTYWLDLEMRNQLVSKGHPYPHSLYWMHLAAAGIYEDDEAPWLTAPYCRAGSVIFHRSSRYHNPAFPWQRFRDENPNAVFLGLKDEHQAFVQKFGPVKFHPVSDMLEMAQFINGADLIIANQSCVGALAIALGKELIQETRCDGPEGMDCIFRKRNNITYCLKGQLTKEVII